MPLINCQTKIKNEESESNGISIEEPPKGKFEWTFANITESQRPHDSLHGKLGEQLECESTQELKAAIKKKLKPVLKRTLEDDIKAEFGGDLKKLKSEMMSDLMLGLTSDFKKAVKKEIENEFKMTVAYQLSSKNKTKANPLDDVNSESSLSSGLKAQRLKRDVCEGVEGGVQDSQREKTE